MRIFKISLFKMENFSLIQTVRYRHTKHWNPRYKKERREKVIKLDLSDLKNTSNQMNQDSKRTKMKEKGIFPQKPWLEKPVYLSCTGNVFEPYIPPEGDGKYSSLSPQGVKQNLEFVLKKTKSYQAVQKIKKYEEEFNVNDFANLALNIYIQAHSTLQRKNEQELTRYVTEKLYPEMSYNLHNKLLLWKFVKSLEPTRVVHARCTSLITDSNIFAQITARLHTQQILAIYDRFGRLVHGSEILRKDVLEYIVFEKHLSNEYGQWRLHAKILPLWMPPYQANSNTFVVTQ
jgi:large subunit ribosomal protein L45